MSKFTGCISTLCTTFKGLLKAVDLPSEITNMRQHIMTAGNVDYANHKPSERRICHDFQLLGKHTDFAEFLVAVVKQGRNIYP